MTGSENRLHSREGMVRFEMVGNGWTLERQGRIDIGL
jgi:hypothetical protein